MMVYSDYYKSSLTKHMFDSQSHEIKKKKLHKKRDKGEQGKQCERCLRLSLQ